MSNKVKTKREYWNVLWKLEFLHVDIFNRPRLGLLAQDRTEVLLRMASAHTFWFDDIWEAFQNEKRWL